MILFVKVWSGFIIGFIFECKCNVSNSIFQLFQANFIWIWNQYVSSKLLFFASKWRY